MLRGFATAAIVVAAFFFLLLAGGAHLQLEEARRLIAAGNVAQGTVTSLTAPRGSQAYSYAYEYAVGGKRYSKSNRSIPYGLKDTVPVGTPIQVWYDPRRPEVATTQAELADHESIANRVLFPLVAVALIAWAVKRTRRRPPATPPGSPGSR